MENKKGAPRFPMPMRGLLLLVGMYTFAWGAFFKWFGEPLLSWLAIQIETPIATNTNVFGSFGMLIGFLVFLSAFYPISWLYFILAGIIGKLISGVWFILAYGELLGFNKRTLFHLGFNEFAGMIILSIILIRALKVKKYLKTLPD
ncbi:hypothetical protein QWY93_07045 [Echinicola jeungdonensis]|uniref:DUF4345 domain-containing protein n=1 Tax=Echinicola jeungdonensis TaxID=709343 RepID=A0ABV5J7G1_9BACT|nr:hypothetical protein [Echinicola jeungdonensis]MDN3669079.1 hypothetical protein [Echinicola jeungdonensis]